MSPALTEVEIRSDFHRRLFDFSRRHAESLVATDFELLRGITNPAVAAYLNHCASLPAPARLDFVLSLVVASSYGAKLAGMESSSSGQALRRQHAVRVNAALLERGLPPELPKDLASTFWLKVTSTVDSVMELRGTSGSARRGSRVMDWTRRIAGARVTTIVTLDESRIGYSHTLFLEGTTSPIDQLSVCRWLGITNGTAWDIWPQSAPAAVASSLAACVSTFMTALKDLVSAQSS